MKPADAIRTLQDAGYILGDTSEVKTDKVPIGFVAYTTPGAGEELKDGSAGRHRRQRGDGRGSRRAHDDGVDPVHRRDHAEGPRSHPCRPQSPIAHGVCRTRDGAGARHPGRACPAARRWCSRSRRVREPKTVAVPNVDGKSQSDAEAAIKNAGLTPKVVQAVLRRSCERQGGSAAAQRRREGEAGERGRDRRVARQGCGCGHRAQRRRQEGSRREDGDVQRRAQAEGLQGIQRNGCVRTRDLSAARRGYDHGLRLARSPSRCRRASPRPPETSLFPR